MGTETFCPSCMRKAEIAEGSVRLTIKMHRARMDSAASEEMDALLRSAIKSGNLGLTSDTASAVRTSGFVVITVGTPIDPQHRPDTSALVAASKAVGEGLMKGTVVIVRSTVSPGTTEGLVGSILTELSGLVPGKDFGLAHVPETTIEGLALFELKTLPKMIGAVDSRSAKAAAALFDVFGTPVHLFDGPTTTETAKLFLNTYRDVNIALANELALACEALGVDVMKVIEATRVDPKTNLLVPGPGVGGFCLPPWSKVHTSSGLRTISSIAPGDLVLSHDGRYHRVAQVMRRPYSGPIVRIAGRGFYSYPIECTPEHPILIRKRIYNGNLFYNSKGKKKMSRRRGVSEQLFTRADAIDQGDILCLPTPIASTPEIPSIPFSHDYHRRGIWQELSCTPDVMYLFGLYIAEGSVWDNQTTFYLHKDEEFIVDELNSISLAVFGNGVRVNSKRGNGMSARLHCRPLTSYLKATFGHEAWNKTVPTGWATSLPEDHLRSLLRGIWLGDGSNSQGVFTYGGTSESLWNFLQLSFLRLGIRFSISELPEHLGRDGTWHRRSYYLKSSDMEGMNELLHPAQRLTRKRQEYRTMWYENGFLEFPIRNVSTRLFKGEVWNLEVEESNTFVLQGGVVHNCLTKDAYYLIQPAAQNGFTPRLLTLAREVNDGMPAHVCKLLLDGFSEAGADLAGSRIAVLGVAFKGNTSDTRESPSLSVINELLDKGLDVVVHDPMVKADDPRLLTLKVERAKTVRDCLEGASAALLLTDHLEYRGLTGATMKKGHPTLKVVVDARHILDPAEARAAGLIYRGVGHGKLN